MPKQTFFNLTEEKRRQIIDIAIDEFADNDYEKASISKIVARAGIAKGSFYQYFADKDDLYGYLISLIAEKKAAAFSLDHPDPEHVGIFNYMRWIFRILALLRRRPPLRISIPEPLTKSLFRNMSSFKSLLATS